MGGPSRDGGFRVACASRLDGPLRWPTSITRYSSSPRTSSARGETADAFPRVDGGDGRAVHARAQQVRPRRRDHSRRHGARLEQWGREARLRRHGRWRRRARGGTREGMRAEARAEGADGDETAKRRARTSPCSRRPSGVGKSSLSSIGLRVGARASARRGGRDRDERRCGRRGGGRRGCGRRGRASFGRRRRFDAILAFILAFIPAFEVRHGRGHPRAAAVARAACSSSRAWSSNPSRRSRRNSDVGATRRATSLYSLAFRRTTVATRAEVGYPARVVPSCSAECCLGDCSSAATRRPTSTSARGESGTWDARTRVRGGRGDAVGGGSIDVAISSTRRRRSAMRAAWLEHKRESRVRCHKSGRAGGGAGAREPAAGRPNAGVAAGTRRAARGRRRRGDANVARFEGTREPSMEPKLDTKSTAASPAGVSTWRRQTWRRRRERGSTRTTSGQTTTTKTTTRAGEENDRGRARSRSRAREVTGVVSESRLPVTSHDKLARGACAFFRRIRCGLGRASPAVVVKRARLVGWPALRGWRSRRRWSRRSSSRWRIGSDGWA